MDIIIVDALLVPLSFIRFCGSIIGDEYPREELDLIVGVCSMHRDLAR